MRRSDTLANPCRITYTDSMPYRQSVTVAPEALGIARWAIKKRASDQRGHSLEWQIENEVAVSDGVRLDLASDSDVTFNAWLSSDAVEPLPVRVIGYSDRRQDKGLAFFPLPGALHGVPLGTPQACSRCGTRRSARHLLLQGEQGNLYALGSGTCLTRALQGSGVNAEILIESVTTDLSNLIAGIIKHSDMTLDPVVILGYSMQLHRTGQPYASSNSHYAAGSNTQTIRARWSIERGEIAPDIDLLAAHVLRSELLEGQWSESNTRVTLTSSESDLLANARRVLSHATMWRGDVGILAYLPYLLARLEREQAQSLQPDWADEWVGAIGERITMTVKPEERIRILDRAGCEWEKLVFRSPDNHCITWFTSPGKFPSMSFPGREVTLVATVKKHVQFRGQWETNVNRCRIKS